jgi:hypothetical protein
LCCGALAEFGGLRWERVLVLQQGHGFSRAVGANEIGGGH